MSKYWPEREFEEKQRLLTMSITKLERAMKRGYRQVANRLIKEIRALYLELKSVGELTPDGLYRYNRYWTLLNRIETELTVLSKKQEELFKSEMYNLYMGTTALISEEFPIVADINEYKVELAINQVWCSDGKSWSSRIWKNKDALKEALSKTLLDAVITGHTTQSYVMKDVLGADKNVFNNALKSARGNKELTDQLKKDFDSAYKNSKRLVITELARVENVATLDRYKAIGVDKVQILTFDDSPSSKPEARAKHPEKGDVCEHCKEFEGKIYFIDDCPVLPDHPNCRCSYVAYLGEGEAIKYSLSKGE